MFQKVAIDFSSGMHGHFLEYIINRYIYDVAEQNTVFQSTGAVDGIKSRQDYQNSKAVHCNHYSIFDTPYPEDTDAVVYIKHNPELDIVLLTNIYYRCLFASGNDYNVDAQKIIDRHKNVLEGNEDWELRNNWYAKLVESHLEKGIFYEDRTLPVVNFNFECFFEFPKFVAELQKISKFVNRTLRFDSSIYTMWHKFMQVNQGYNLYKLGNDIIAGAYGNLQLEIPNDWQLHAYINYMLTYHYRIYDSILHTGEKYPTNTLTLHKIVNQHVSEQELA